MNGSIRRQLTGWLFVLPWLIALTVFLGYPFFSGLYFSFCDYPPLKGPMFIGADNYSELAGDATFHRSLGVTMLYASLAIPLGVVLAMSLAMLLNSRIRGQSFYRVIFYLPHLVPTVAVAVLWMWIFNGSGGLVNLVLRGVMGRMNAAVDFLFHNAQGWRSLGFLVGWAMLLVGPVALAITIAARRRVSRATVWVSAVTCVPPAAVAAHALLLWVSPVDMRRLAAGPDWLGSGEPIPSAMPFAPATALWALIIMSMWGVGQMAVIYLAKLQDVPAELYEAAEIDGANWWAKTRHITIPMISPVILFNVVMAVIGTFQVFTEPYIMTGGGPERKTYFVAMFVYEQAFQFHRLGYASAVAWVLFVVIVALTLLVFRVSRKHVHYFGR